MSALIDLTGKQFERLTVIERAGSYRSWNSPETSSAMWRCRCECGNEVIVRGANLRAGLTRSCGCLRREISSLPKVGRGQPRKAFAWGDFR
jgi:hypothetical protein